jgi:hypothetical protein
MRVGRTGADEMRGLIHLWLEALWSSMRASIAPVTLAFAVILPASIITYTLDQQLILPALSVLLFIYAALTVMLAWWFGVERKSKGLTLWDISGGLAMIGCAATIFGEPEQIVKLFEYLFQPQTRSR